MYIVFSKPNSVHYDLYFLTTIDVYIVTFIADMYSSKTDGYWSKTTVCMGLKNCTCTELNESLAACIFSF